jgi:hypothetical protein
MPSVHKDTSAATGSVDIPTQLAELCSRLQLPAPIVLRPEPDPPLFVISVDEDAAEATAALLRTELVALELWPLLVDPSEYDDDMPELIWETGNLESGYAALERSRAIDAEQILEAEDLPRLEALAEQLDDSVEISEIDLVGVDDYSGEILLVPATQPWESLAVIGFGGSNDGFGPAEHAAIARWLSDTIDAVPFMVGADRLGFLTRSDERTIAQTRAVASRLRDYCSDIGPTVDYSYGVAQRLLQPASFTMRLWWD